MAVVFSHENWIGSLTQAARLGRVFGRDISAVAAPRMRSAGALRRRNSNIETISALTDYEAPGGRGLITRIGLDASRFVPHKFWTNVQ